MYKHTIIRTFSQLSLLLVILGLASCSGDDLTGSENINAGTNDDFITNPGIVSQDNFIVLASDLEPAIFADPGSSTHTFTEVSITVKLGDKRNQRLTDTHTIHFMTEWGLITPSCNTNDNGECTVVWNTSSSEQAPADHKNTILAYTIGEESFDDTNGNFIFDNNDTTFRDMEEPFVDSNWDGVHNGEPIADVVNANGVHDLGDMLLNSTSCTHASLCNTTRTTIYVWNDDELNMDGPAP